MICRNWWGGKSVSAWLACLAVCPTSCRVYERAIHDMRSAGDGNEAAEALARMQLPLETVAFPRASRLSQASSPYPQVRENLAA